MFIPFIHVYTLRKHNIFIIFWTYIDSNNFRFFPTNESTIPQCLQTLLQCPLRVTYHYKSFWIKVFLQVDSIIYRNWFHTDEYSLWDDSITVSQTFKFFCPNSRKKNIASNEISCICVFIFLSSSWLLLSHPLRNLPSALLGITFVL